jgi:hypothetical protein
LLGRQIFYLNQSNCIQINDFSIESVAKALSGGSFEPGGGRGHLEQLVTAPPEEKFKNPITQHFGGVDMVNVAAATGVATGQFYNFLRYVIQDGGIFSRYPELIDIVLIKPGRIKDVDRVIGLLDQKFGEPKTDFNGNVILDKGLPKLEVRSKWEPEETHPRKSILVKRIGNHLVDYPTPISSLSVSRQFLEFDRFLREFSKAKGYSDEKVSPFDSKIIRIYFDTLRELSDNPANTCDWGRVEVLTVEEALEHLAR